MIDLIRHDKFEWKRSHWIRRWRKHYFCVVSSFMRKIFLLTLLEAVKYFDCFFVSESTIHAEYGDFFSFLKWFFLKWMKREDESHFRESHILALTLDLSRLSCQLMPLVSSNHGWIKKQSWMSDRHWWKMNYISFWRFSNSVRVCTM